MIFLLLMVTGKFHRIQNVHFLNLLNSKIMLCRNCLKVTNTGVGVEKMMTCFGVWPSPVGLTKNHCLEKIFDFSFKIRRPSSRYARYRMMSHSREKTNARNSKRRQLVNRWRYADFVQEFRWKNEGLNQTNYHVVSREFTKIYVNITVDCLYDERNGRN